MTSEKSKISQSRLTTFFTKVEKRLPTTDNQVEDRNEDFIQVIKQEPEASFVLILPTSDEEQKAETNGREIKKKTKAQKPQGKSQQTDIKLG